MEIRRDTVEIRERHWRNERESEALLRLQCSVG
jgi:hypothetical protein